MLKNNAIHRIYYLVVIIIIFIGVIFITDWLNKGNLNDFLEGINNDN